MLSYTSVSERTYFCMSRTSPMTKNLASATDQASPTNTPARPRLVVVGNGMAGMRTVEELYRLVPDYYHITVIGREPHGNYNRVMLSPVLAGDKAFADIIIHDDAWYAERGITLISGQAVTRVDRARRLVETDQGLSLPYERLLMATGSDPFMLPIPGHDHADVISFRAMADVTRMHAAAAANARVIVIGGGLLGLEAAWGLVQQGVDVTVVHDGNTLLNRQIDEEAGVMLFNALSARGIRILTAKQTIAIDHDALSGKLSALRFADGSTIPADLIVMAIGVRPNVALARSMGLRVDRAIVVNDTLQTFDPRIYAVGECVQHRGSLFGLVAPLYEQAAICANHLAGMGYGRYTQTATGTSLKVNDIALYSAGDFGHPEAEHLIYRDRSRGVYKKLCLHEGCLVAVVLYGDTQDGAWYFELIRSARDISALRQQLMFGQVLCTQADAAAELAHAAINQTKGQVSHATA